MRKFLSEQFVANVALPEEFRETFTSFFKKYQTSLMSESVPVGLTALFNMSTHNQLGIFNLSDISYLSLPSAYKLMNLDSDDRQLLTETYKAMYPDKHIRADMVSEVCRKYSSVTLAGEKIGSRLECRSLRSARVMASWADQDGQVNPTAAIRPGFVKFIFTNTIRFENNQYKKHVFACTEWYKEDSQRELYRRPVEIWKLKSFNQPGPAVFIPVQRVYWKFAAAHITMNRRTEKLIVCPIQRTFC